MTRDERPPFVPVPRTVVVVFAEHSSANLGDQAISDSLTELLSSRGLTVDRRSLTDYSPVRLASARSNGSVARASTLSPLSSLRTAARRSMTLRLVRSMLLRGRLRATVAQSDVVLIGGGALLQDNALRFPLALSEIARACRNSRTPLLLAGVSTEGELSNRAVRLLGRAVKEAQAIFVRDLSTAEMLHARWAATSTALGDFAASSPRVRAHPRLARVGVNIKAGMTTDEWEAARAFTRKAVESREVDSITVFTTGVSEDARAARMFIRAVPEIDSPLILREPVCLDDLTEYLRNIDYVYPARLHSAILALREGAAVVRPHGSRKVVSYLESEVDCWSEWNSYTTAEATAGSRADERRGARDTFLQKLVTAAASARDLKR